MQKFVSDPAELEKLVERLESAVSRLEKVAGCFQPPSSPLATSAPESTASESLTNSPLCQTSPPFTMSLAAYQDIVNVIIIQLMLCLHFIKLFDPIDISRVLWRRLCNVRLDCNMFRNKLLSSRNYSSEFTL